MRFWGFGSVRLRTTVAATVVTAVVLALASVVIVQLVERDLESSARVALGDAFESASHSVSGEDSAHGESTEGAEGAVGSDPEGSAESGEAGRASSGDVLQQQLTDASIREVQAGVDAASGALLVIVPVVVLLLGGAIWFTVGRALQPVRDISSRVAAISGSTLDERVPEPRSDDEIAELAGLMNEMLDRLQAASDRQRAFVADASHELKSPLSTIVAAAEIAEVSSDPQRLASLASKIGTEGRRMQALVADLLDLARLDEQRRHDRDLAEVDLGELCRRVAERFDDGSVDISVATGGPAEVVGVESQFERAVFNVVDNAAAHAVGRVKVTTGVSGETVEVLVEDDGPGIAEADRERVFDRLVRLDESRGRGSGGTGIGLSLVRAIVDRHGGTVQISKSVELGGASVRIGLPRRSESVAGRLDATRFSANET